MRRSSIHSIFRLANQQNTYYNPHGSIYLKYLLNKSNILFSTNKSKLIYGFSTNDKKPVTEV